MLGNCAAVTGTQMVPSERMLCGLLVAASVPVLTGDTLLFRLTEHVQDKSKLPILIFPEGELWTKARQAPAGEGTAWQHHISASSFLRQPRASRPFTETKGTLCP